MEHRHSRNAGQIAAGAIIVGIMLYLSKFLRPSFKNYEEVLNILGFLPNFGLAFTIPFIYASNRIRLNKPIKHFILSCIITLFLMVLNEIRDKYQSGRVFDWNDIYASVAGTILAFLVFEATKKTFNTYDQSAKS